MRSAPKPNAHRSRVAATSANTSPLSRPYFTLTSSPPGSAQVNFGVLPLMSLSTNRQSTVAPGAKAPLPPGPVPRSIAATVVGRQTLARAIDVAPAVAADVGGRRLGGAPRRQDDRQQHSAGGPSAPRALSLCVHRCTPSGPGVVVVGFLTRSIFPESTTRPLVAMALKTISSPLISAARNTLALSTTIAENGTPAPVIARAQLAARAGHEVRDPPSCGLVRS